MAYGIKLEVWGDLAAFNRPEMKVERVSYDAMTPGAARGILDAIYWKPEMRWVVDEIHVLSPIRFTHVRRNEGYRKEAEPWRKRLPGRSPMKLGCSTGWRPSVTGDAGGMTTNLAV